MFNVYLYTRASGRFIPRDMFERLLALKDEQATLASVRSSGIRTEWLDFFKHVFGILCGYCSNCLSRQCSEPINSRSSSGPCADSTESLSVHWSIHSRQDPAAINQQTSRKHFFLQFRLIDIGSKDENEKLIFTIVEHTKLNKTGKAQLPL